TAIPEPELEVETPGPWSAEIVVPDPTRIWPAGTEHHDAIREEGAQVAGRVADVHDIRRRIVNVDVPHVIEGRARGNGIDHGRNGIRDDPRAGWSVRREPDGLAHRVIPPARKDHVGVRVDGILHRGGLDR